MKQYCTVGLNRKSDIWKATISLKKCKQLECNRNRQAIHWK